MWTEDWRGASSLSNSKCMLMRTGVYFLCVMCVIIIYASGKDFYRSFRRKNGSVYIIIAIVQRIVVRGGEVYVIQRCTLSQTPCT